MFKQIIKSFRREVSAQGAMNHLNVLTTHHRIQASPGYRAAATYCLERLQSYGLQTELVRYPARTDVYFGNYRSFREWRCREGELWLTAPTRRRLACFTEMEMSIIQRSTATPTEGIDTELIYVEAGDREESYKNLDVRGKIVLSRGDQHRIFEMAVVRNGAAGIVLDNMASYPPLRTREDLYDAVQYTSFWWHDEPQTGFGFAVSPRTGDELRALCAAGPVRVFARVDAELVPGEMENVEALIPGETDEEVLLISHLCHPKPGANDNASGPSVLIETARALQRLIDSGELPRPKRSIRFLMIPEMTGTHAHIHHKQAQIARTVAALNLDMVGASQRHGGGPLTIEKPSRALPSFTAELAYAIFDEVAREYLNSAGTHAYALTNYVATSFTGGSDHYILADPSVGIPCPMLITWPDKYYHTSFDTPEHIDPKLLGQVAVTSATYLYWLANADVYALLALAGKMAAGSADEFQRLLSACLDGQVAPELATARLDFLRERKTADLHSLERLVSAEQLPVWEAELVRKIAFIDSAYELCAHELQALTGATATAAAAIELDDPLLDRRFVRRHAGPIDLRGWLLHLPAADQDRWHDLARSTPRSHTLMTFLEYWMDGKRTLREVIRCVELEAGMKNVPFALDYVRLLQRLGLLAEA